VEIADALAAAYDLGPDLAVAPLPGPGINNQVLEVRSGGVGYVLKHYQTHSREDTIEYEHRLLAWLDAQPLPFRVPVAQRARDASTLWWHEGAAYTLFLRLAGRHVWPPSLRELEQIGAALAHLHQALAHYPQDERPGLHGYGKLAHVHPALPQPAQIDAGTLGLDAADPVLDELGWWRDEVERLACFVETHYRGLPHQVIHGDYAPSNTLFDAGRLVAVLDFEMALPDVRAMDVAAGLTFAMRVDEWPDPWARVAAFCRGYGAVQRLTAAEVVALPDLMALRDVVSTIWWLGRGLAAGDVRGALGRIAKTHRRRDWCVAHGAALVACCAPALGGISD
jgi:homoserine kinase type II